MAPVTDEKKSPLEEAVERALDLFFYAPVGLVLGADEVVPQLIERGKQQVAAARMFGQFAVEQGGAEAAKAVARVQESAASTLEQLGWRHSGRSRSNNHEATAAPARSAAGEPAPSPDGPSAGVASNGPAANALAIPDYDSLSASQVVPRLAGLSREELEAVRTYESEHRGRKTILNRVAQLQR